MQLAAFKIGDCHIFRLRMTNVLVFISVFFFRLDFFFQSTAEQTIQIDIDFMFKSRETKK